jgi:protease II
MVPFVDRSTTMLDESIPLTIGEYEEGNPHAREVLSKKSLSTSAHRCAICIHCLNT